MVHLDTADSFGAFYDEWHPFAVLLARASVSDDVAKDLAQRIFVRLWRSGEWMIRRARSTSLVLAVVVTSLTPLHVASQDTTVVSVDNAPAWGDEARLVEEVRIGTLLGDVEYALGPVGGVVVTSDGTIWVGDQYVAAIRRFRPDGSYIDMVGRKGEGPGEFRTVGELASLPDGGVAAWDSGLLRVTLFDEDGTFRDSFPVPTSMMSGGRLIRIFKADADGSLYVMGSDFADFATRVVSGQDLSPRSSTSWFWIKMRPDGRVLDSVHLLPGDQEGTVDPIRTNTALSHLGHRITGRTDRYALTLHLADDRITRLERPHDPVLYQPEEWREKNRLEGTFSERNGRPAREISRQKPVFYTLDVDDTGRIWVELYARGFTEAETPGEQELRERYDGVRREWRQPRIYDVLDTSGCYFGRIRFPNRNTTVEVARGNLVWVVEKGRFDEPYVVRYRIVPSRETPAQTGCR